MGLLLIGGAAAVQPVSIARGAVSVDAHIRMLQSQIKPGQAAGHVALAQYLYQHAMYQRALTQVDAALAISPGNQNAVLLKSLIATAIKNGAVAHPTRHSSAGGKRSGGLLSTVDIDQIRLAEWSDKEALPMRGVITERVKTLSAFWKKWIAPNPLYQQLGPTRQTYEQFLRLNNFSQQVKMILQVGDPKFTRMIVIRENPQVIQTYRTTVQPFVLQSCSTVGCHRGQDFHGFKLFGARSTPNLAQTYTNFYILSRYAYKGHKLIDRSNPYDSLLIQYLLPREIAAVCHPGKKKLSHRAFNESAVISWISSLAFPSPSYGIKYKLPVAGHGQH